MIGKRTIYEIHRLKNMGFSNRQIAGNLRLDRGTVARYLENPDRTKTTKKCGTTKLDPFRELVREMIEQYPGIKAPVVHRHLLEKGFDGKITIVRDYIRHVRGRSSRREPFIRFESEPGRQMQADWGHFGSLTYGKTKRKLYALAVIESHSRMLHVTFTHSQKQEALHRGLLDAFTFFGGTPDEIVVDNMMTAVTERLGPMIRFNEAFLDFLRPFRITPVACNVRSPHEKGKVENAVKYLRYNFWPLRTFENLRDVRAQALVWLDTVANVRIHQTTGERPADRFKKDALRSLPETLPDCGETHMLGVHKDFGIRFDANVYTSPPWTVGKKIVVRADFETVRLYYKDRNIATHVRCWDRKQRIELPSHREQVKKLKKRTLRDRQVLVFLSFGPQCADYLELLSTSGIPVKKTVGRLLGLKDEYGAKSLVRAVSKALDRKLFGAEYIENILIQEMTPKREHAPVKLKTDSLNNIRLSSPSLAEYDAYALERRGKNNG
jgi:transposase